MFDLNGNRVTDPAGPLLGPDVRLQEALMATASPIPLDRCSGLMSDCKKRFGEYEVINFGGFPSADLIRG